MVIFEDLINPMFLTCKCYPMNDIMKELEKLEQQVNKQNITVQGLKKKLSLYTFYVNQVKLNADPRGEGT